MKRGKCLQLRGRAWVGGRGDLGFENVRHSAADIASHHVYPLYDSVQIEQGSAVLIIITSVIPDPTVENGHPFPSKGPFDGTISYMDLRCNLGPCLAEYALSESLESTDESLSSSVFHVSVHAGCQSWC